MLAASAARASRNLAVQFGKGRRAPRIQVKEIPRKSPRLMVIMDSCVLARDMPNRGITTTARNALGNDALRRLQVHVSLREVFRKSPETAASAQAGWRFGWA